MYSWIFRDHWYKEADGLTVIYHGYCDVVNSETEESRVMLSIGPHDMFGDSTITKAQSYEHLGDIYAGLYPKGLSAYTQ